MKLQNVVIEFSLVILTKGVFERCTPTGKETFSLLICLEATTCGTLNVSTLLETIWWKVWARALLSNAKSPLPVDVRRLKTFFFLSSLLIHLEEGFFLGEEGGYYQMYCLLVVGPITWGEGLISFVSFGTSFLFCTWRVCVFLSADKYSVGQQQEISLEIKPTSHTGLLLSSWNAKGDYIVLEMSNGNVSNVLGRCDAFNLNWSKLWCKVNPSKVGSLYISGKLPTYPSP